MISGSIKIPKPTPASITQGKMHNSKPSWAQSNRLQTYSMMNNKEKSAALLPTLSLREISAWIWTCGLVTLTGYAIGNKQDLSSSIRMKTDACLVSVDLTAVMRCWLLSDWLNRADVAVNSFSALFRCDDLGLSP